MQERISEVFNSVLHSRGATAQTMKIVADPGNVGCQITEGLHLGNTRRIQSTRGTHSMTGVVWLRCGFHAKSRPPEDAGISHCHQRRLC
jgi:hypothetical protein